MGVDDFAEYINFVSKYNLPRNAKSDYYFFSIDNCTEEQLQEFTMIKLRCSNPWT